MYRFTYHQPATLDAAVQLAASTEDGSYLAGGMTLLPTMKFRLANPSDLIDLGGVEELRGISEEDGRLRIGASSTHAEVAASALVADRMPALAELASRIGDPAVRNRGTIGGSIANADPAADYPAALLALDAEVITNRRTIAAADFFTGFFSTALAPGELVTAVRFATPAQAGYQKAPNPASRFALVGVFVARHADGVRVAVTGAGPYAARYPAFEAALDASFTPEAAAGVPVDEAGLTSDLHASAAYRAHLIGIMAKRAVAAC
ncbi:MAG: xanthine dehydrogenase family protein subunit M [Rhodospirillales bacterium]|nr:xanthine dehydrogenase family protein subunit M [Rhodospirillales bacterium]MDE0713124.1 xanthine dehydrogenase family protein subunit M [Rhodospirillales bacterium]